MHWISFSLNLPKSGPCLELVVAVHIRFLDLFLSQIIGDHHQAFISRVGSVRYHSLRTIVQCPYFWTFLNPYSKPLSLACDFLVIPIKKWNPAHDQATTVLNAWSSAWLPPCEPLEHCFDYLCECLVHGLDFLMTRVSFLNRYHSEITC